jgi:hypothetical protein
MINTKNERKKKKDENKMLNKGKHHSYIFFSLRLSNRFVVSYFYSLLIVGYNY